MNVDAAWRDGEGTTVEQLSNAVAGIRGEDIADAQMDRAGLIVLDTIGCAIGGWIEEPAQRVVRVVEGLGGAPDCQVIGSSLRTSAPNATLANGMLCRVLDLNDYLVGTGASGGNSGGHPSDSIPIALAFAELAHRSGRELLASIVIGYEIYGRVRQYQGSPPNWDGVSGTGFVAPVIAGWLMGLDKAQLANALALSVARCATSAMVRTGDISSAKSMANSLVAETGARAVILANEGISGPLAVLDHPRGMSQVFTNSDSRASLVAPLSDPKFILQSNIKPYPCLATGQAAVAAAIALRDQLKGGLDQVARLRIVMADRGNVRRQQADPGRTDPRSKEAADHSFPFLVAVALIDGQLGPAQFEGERWNDTAVRAIMNRIEMTVDPALVGPDPTTFPCRLEAIDTAGQKHAVEIDRPPGLAKFGIDEKMVIDKFHATASRFLGQSQCDRLVDATMNLKRVPDLGPLASALAQPISGLHA